MSLVLQWISQYGYGALFGLLMLGIVGLPIPDETILVFCGYLIAIDRLHAPQAFLSALAGAVCGISISFWLGRTVGHSLVERYGRYLHVTMNDLQRVQLWFTRFGNWLLAFGYFVPGVRHFTALVAGSSRVPVASFALFAYTGAALWVTTFLSLGYLFGENWPALVSLIHRFTLPFLVVICGLLLLIWLIWKRKRVID